MFGFLVYPLYRRLKDRKREAKSDGYVQMYEGYLSLGLPEAEAHQRALRRYYPELADKPIE